MTSTAQMALRRIMEKYTANTRFCIIANYTHKLSPALLSRCTRFRFSPLKEPDIRSLVDLVIERENVRIEEEATQSLVKLSSGDMRRALNVLQACHASSTPSLDIQSSNFPLTTSPRYPPPNKRPPPTPHHILPPHYRLHHLHLHRLPPPLHHLHHPQHPTLHPRRHLLPLHDQHPKIHARARVSGYLDRVGGGVGEVGGPRADEG